MEFYTSVKQIGNKLYYRGYLNDSLVQYTQELSPVLYIKTNSTSLLKTLDGDNVEPIRFESVYEARNFIDQYKDVEDFTVYGYEKFHYVELCKKYPATINYEFNKIRIFYIDIETTTTYGFPNVKDPQEELLCITIKDSYTNNTITWGTREVKQELEFQYIYCVDEMDLMKKLLEYWQHNTPDIITGWNILLFDIPYMVNRIVRVLGEDYIKKLSPWKKIKSKSVVKFNKECVIYEIVGISQLDYLDLYKKFTYITPENYKLDTIGELELGVGKLDHSEYSSFSDFYNNDWETFLRYNNLDVELIYKLENKLKLLELAVSVAYDAKINFDEIYAQTCAWDSIIYNYLYDKNIVVPSKEIHEKTEKFDGAYVKEPVPGMYFDVVSFDLASLYPHIIQLLNISPETKVSNRSNATINSILDKTFDNSAYLDFSIAPSGSLYKNNFVGIMPELMHKYYSERKIYKNKQQQAETEYLANPSIDLFNQISTYKNIQMAKKIAMNSAYGVMGCRYFRYYDIDNANAITSMGQVAIRWISNHINDYLNILLGTNNVDRIITNDTDSLFLNLNDLVKKRFKIRPEHKIITNFLDKFSETIINPFIKKCYNDLGKYLNVKNQCLSMVRDVITSNFLIKGKKRYIANVTDCEGLRYPEPRLKYVGIEVVRSSTPKFFKNRLIESCKLIMTSDNEALMAYVDSIRQDMLSELISDISIGTGVSDVHKYANSDLVCGYTKGTPIGCRAAIIYNKFILTNNLTSKYPLVESGDKIKYVYLKLPNTIKENVFGYIGNIPTESKLEKYIDYDLMLEKSFINPLTELLDIIGWSLSKVSTLDAFFDW